MRSMERSSAFKRDYKRAKATPRNGKDVDSRVSAVVAMPPPDQVLPENHRDHAWAAIGRVTANATSIRTCYRSTACPTPTPCVWRGLARIASYSAEPGRLNLFLT